MLDYKSFLGNEYEIIIDRPAGSFHPKHDDIFYPINYGYLEGVFAEDGEEVDVYVLGTDKPLAKCRAKIIAYSNRLDDDENKLVGSIDDKEYTDTEIAGLIHFQEKFYKTEIVSQ